MAEASATGASTAGAGQQTATDAAKSGEELQKKFDAQAKAQREAYEAEKAKTLSELAEREKQSKATFDAELAKERDRALKAEQALKDAESKRIAKLEERAKSLPEAAQKLAGIAKDKGSEAYEDAIANAEALVASSKPKVQGGNLDGGLDSAKAAQMAELNKLPDAERLQRAREIDARTRTK